MADPAETVEPVEADIPAPKPDSEEAPPPSVTATTTEEENAPAHTLDLPKGATTGGTEDEGIPALTPDENVTLDVPVSGDPQSAAEDAASGAEDGAAEELVEDPDLPVKSIQVFMSPINTWLAVNMIEAFKARRTVPVQSASVPSSRNQTPANDEVPRPTSMREAPVQYKFVGTLAHEGETFNHVNEGVDLPTGLRVVSPDNTAEMTEAVTASDWVICSIADNHDTTAQVDVARTIFDMMKADDGAARESGENREPPKFVLVSTFLTWVRTPMDDPNEPLAADQFLYREPHPSVRPHHELENYVTRHHHLPNLHSSVVSAGMLYGNGEGALEFMFRAAWMPLDHGIPVVDGGNNHVPAIHVVDCSRLVFNVLAQADRPLECYIAVDNAPKDSTMLCVANAVADGFRVRPTTPVHVDHLSLLDAYLEGELSQIAIDVLTSNLHMEASIYTPVHDIAWVSPDGIVANMAARVKEYISERSLHPYRVCVLGPPSSGKTTVARDLALRFGLLMVDTATAIEYAKVDGKRAVERAEKLIETLQASNAEPDALNEAQKRRSKLATEQEVFTTGDTLDNDAVARCVKALLGSKMCVHQGYVLDGYPATAAQVDAMGWSAAAVAANGDVGPENSPDHLVVLDASERCILRKLLVLPQEEVHANDHNSIEVFRQRWADYTAATAHTEKKPAKGGTLKGATENGGFDPVSLFVAVNFAVALRYNLDDFEQAEKSGGTTTDLCTSIAHDLGYATHSEHGKVLTWLAKFQLIFTKTTPSLEASVNRVLNAERWVKRLVQKKHQHYTHHMTLSLHEHAKTGRRRDRHATATHKRGHGAHSKHSVGVHHHKHGSADHHGHHGTMGHHGTAGHHTTLGHHNTMGHHGTLSHHGTVGHHKHETVDHHHKKKDTHGHKAHKHASHDSGQGSPPSERHSEQGSHGAPQPAGTIVPPLPHHHVHHPEPEHRLEEIWASVEELVGVTGPAQTWMQQVVLPGLGTALLEVARERPDDPIEFLSKRLKEHKPKKAGSMGSVAVTANASRPTTAADDAATGSIAEMEEALPPADAPVEIPAQ
eukprot:m.10662 g.10662  ORF g.10662 m.10662 type:complete len:1059 (-) comp4346_c0_seq1:1767-4943(-)